jgi:hypothetical protein
MQDHYVWSVIELKQYLLLATVLQPCTVCCLLCAPYNNVVFADGDAVMTSRMQSCSCIVQGRSLSKGVALC